MEIPTPKRRKVRTVPEIKAPKSAKTAKKNPRRERRICEYMTYSGREAFKRLRTNTMIALDGNKEKQHYVLGITSAQPSEGKSTVSINLAYSLAELGKSVLLIDGDMRRPSISSIVEISQTPGLNDVLSGAASLNDSVVSYKSVTDTTSFKIIPSGEIADNPSELLNSIRFQKLITAASDVFDYVLIDLPPVNAVVDAVNASAYTDGLIVVVRERNCPRYVLDRCMEQLQYAKANILGFVMNGCVEGAGKYYRYKEQPYYYRYEK